MTEMAPTLDAVFQRVNSTIMEAVFTHLWTELLPDNPEVIHKISQGILIAFSDDHPALLRWLLQLRGNNKASDLQQALHKLLESHAKEEVPDLSSTL